MRRIFIKRISNEGNENGSFQCKAVREAVKEADRSYHSRSIGICVGVGAGAKSSLLLRTGN